jgi:hypothetical protein
VDHRRSSHFIDPTGALNIKRNFNTIVLISTLCFKTLQIFYLNTSFKTLVKTLVDHRRSSLEERRLSTSVLTSVLKEVFR